MAGSSAPAPLCATRISGRSAGRSASAAATAAACCCQYRPAPGVSRRSGTRAVWPRAARAAAVERQVNGLTSGLWIRTKVDIGAARGRSFTAVASIIYQLVGVGGGNKRPRAGRYTPSGRDRAGAWRARQALAVAEAGAEGDE